MMRSFIVIFVILLPQIIFAIDNTKSDSEKYQYQQNHHLDRTSNSLYCNDLNPQTHIDFNMLYGLWYGAEIITHHETEAYETTYDTCVVVNLRDGNDLYGRVDDDYRDYNDGSVDRRQSNNDMRRNYNNNNNNNNNYNIHGYGGGSQRRLHLTWDERGRTLNYEFRVDGSRQGLWITTGNQRGSMLEMNYRQFTGTVQVIKAVGNHLVLTFCETLPKSQIFTIILTKKPHHLIRDEIQSVRSLLRRRGLNVQSVRKVCKNSASMNSLSLISIVTFIISTIFLSRH